MNILKLSKPDYNQLFPIVEEHAKLLIKQNKLENAITELDTLFINDFREWLKINITNQAKKSGIKVYRGIRAPITLIKPYLVIPSIFNIVRRTKETSFTLYMHRVLYSDQLKRLYMDYNYNSFSFDIKYTEIVSQDGQRLIQEIVDIIKCL